MAFYRGIFAFLDDLEGEKTDPQIVCPQNT